MLQMRQNIFCVHREQRGMNHFFDAGNVDGSIVNKWMIALDKECQECQAGYEDCRALQKIPRRGERG